MRDYCKPRLSYVVILIASMIIVPLLCMVACNNSNKAMQNEIEEKIERILNEGRMEGEEI